jgi:hypothetical protein
MKDAANFSELAAALRERLEVIADRELSTRAPAEHLARLQAASERIADAAAAIPRPAEPQLEHFLQRASYDKALAWLQQHGL